MTHSDPPWREPQTLPPPATGDDALDALFLGLEGTYQDAAAIAARVKRLGEDGRSEIRSAAIRWIELILDDRPPFPIGSFDPSTLAGLDDAALARTKVAAGAWYLRQWLFANVLEVLTARANDEVGERLVRWIERPADTLLRNHVAQKLLASGLYDALTHHFVTGDPLAPIAGEALVAKEGAAAIPAVRSTFDTMTQGERGQSAVRISRRKAQVDLDAHPEWADVLFPGVLGNTWAIEVSYALHRVRTAEPLLRALRYTDVDVYWSDILSQLRAVDDPRSAAALEAIAKTLPAAEKGKRLSRTSNTVLALVKRLRRKRDVVDRASFELVPGVGTDGGPIVLLAKDVVSAWKGVPPDWNGEGDSDYDRACAASEAGVGSLKIGTRRALVIGEQAVSSATIDGGAVMIVIRGTDLQIEIAMRERGAWKKTKLVLEVGDGGALLLDAAYTVDRAQAGAVAALDLPPGEYAVHQLQSDDLHALRISAR